MQYHNAELYDILKTKKKQHICGSEGDVKTYLLQWIKDVILLLKEYNCYPTNDIFIPYAMSYGKDLIILEDREKRTLAIYKE